MSNRNLLLVIIITAAALVLSSGASAQRKVSYDGLYHTLSDTLDPFRFYLRFYPDGTVIGYTTAGNPQNLVRWFSKDHKAPSKGKYSLKDSTIHFTLKSEEGTVIYDGSILSDNRLWLTVSSQINKYEGKEEYFFWQVDKLK